MSVKLVILKSGEYLISDVKEIISGDNVVGYLFNNPQLIQETNQVFLSEEQYTEKREIEITLSPWIPLSKDLKIPVRPDWVVTIVEPANDLCKMYTDQQEQKGKINSTDDKLGSFDVN